MPTVPERQRRPRAGPARFAALLLATGCEGGQGGAPGLVFHDDFNAENHGVSSVNYTALRRWRVVAGSVDLVGSYPFDLLSPGHGLYLDLDGATNHAATLRSRAALELEPGEYRLSFVLAGPQRQCALNVVHVRLGALYAEAFARAAFDAPVRIARRIRVDAPASAHLEFRHEGGDNFGLLLDDVELRRL